MTKQVKIKQIDGQTNRMHSIINSKAERYAWQEVNKTMEYAALKRRKTNISSTSQLMKQKRIDTTREIIISERAG